MNVWGLFAFNVLLNGVGSFAVAWLLCRAARRVFGDRSGIVMMALSALPFVKVAYDAWRGVPERSFLWQRAQGVPQDLGSFQVGLGVSYGVPKLQLALAALSGDRTFTQSGPDLFAAWLTKHVATWAPGVIAAVLVSIAAALLIRRAHVHARAWQAERALRRSAPQCVARVGRRTIPVFVSDEISGSPHAGGIVRPYVAFPRRVWDALSESERDAALAHELGHVAQRHLAVVVVAGLIADVFWFVPGIRSALRGLRNSCELAADGYAVARGTRPTVLASALLRVKELTGSVPTMECALAAVDEALPARVRRLLSIADLPPTRRSLGRRIGRAMALVWVATTVLFALAFGNH